MELPLSFEGRQFLVHAIHSKLFKILDMKLKSAISLLFIACLALFFSACTSAESKEQKEVVIDKSSTGSTKTDEVYITNADVKKVSEENEQVSTTMSGGSVNKNTLSDSSQVDTLTDAFGNKTQTRYFTGNPRIRMLVMRTSVKGVQEVTVYGNGGDTKLVNGLADRALSASGDEIADAAGLVAAPSSGAAKNYMKRQPTQSSQMQQQPLQPLPSSAFQQPAPVRSAETATTTQPAGQEEDED